MVDMKKLVANAKGFSILYVEDNNALRNNASKLLHKFFDTVYSAENGKEGLKLFKKHLPQIVITDIKMPLMDGITLSKNIKTICPKTKIMIMSAFDDKEYLYTAIELGVFRFIKKPVNITELSQVLFEALEEIKHERNSQLFNIYLKNVFDYQSSMVIMIKDKKPIIANQSFLDFFDVENIGELLQKYKDFGDKFLEHDGFLYNHENRFWFDEVLENRDKLYHVKIKDKEENTRHFIFKFQHIPEKESYSVLSFDDVTELNLLKLFDEKASKDDENFKDSKAMFNLLEVLQRNSAKVELHNYYKGLTITNDAIITEVNENSIIVKTNYLQEKAIQYEQKSIIVSDALPKHIICEKIVKIGFDNQSVELGNIHFILTSPVTRKTIRLVPESKHTVSLFLGDNKFQGELFIEDISLDAIKLNLNALPAGLEKGDDVLIDIVLEMDKKPFIINSRAKYVSKRELQHSFSLVFMFDGTKKNELIKYITKRQMAIIREFKGLGNG